MWMSMKLYKKTGVKSVVAAVSIKKTSPNLFVSDLGF